MDSPFRIPPEHEALVAEVGIIEYFSMMFHKAVLEAEKAHPANFIIPETVWLH